MSRGQIMEEMVIFWLCSWALVEKTRESQTMMKKSRLPKIAAHRRLLGCCCLLHHMFATARDCLRLL
ncbi:hypothetical protein TB1_032476 [Malus domestica]